MIPTIGQLHRAERYKLPIRDICLVDRRYEGETYRQLAESIGVTLERARQIFLKYKIRVRRTMRDPDKEYERYMRDDYWDAACWWRVADGLRDQLKDLVEDKK